MSYILKTCSHCNNEFQASKREHNRGNAKFCSKKCFHDQQRAKERVVPEPNVSCATCNVMFYRPAGKQKMAKHGYQFCSRVCKELAQSITSGVGIVDIMPSHYDPTTPVWSHRDLIRRTVGFIACEECGYDKHPEILEVHHKDRNSKNNVIENLAVLCPNCHVTEHFLAGDGRFGKKGQRKSDEIFVDDRN